MKGLLPERKYRWNRTGHGIACLLIAGVLTGATIPLRGTDLRWTGAINRYWSEPGNWNPAGVPANGDTMEFRAGDANRSMINDLEGLKVSSLIFGFDGNDSDYTLDGNALTILHSSIQNGSDIYFNPDGSATLTINCPLDFSEEGGTITAKTYESGILFHHASTIRLNGPITVRRGSLEFFCFGYDGLAGSSGRIYVSGGVSGNINVSVRADGAESFVEFNGSQSISFAGGLFLENNGGSQTILNSTAGNVVTNRVVVLQENQGNLRLARPNQIGPDAVIALTNGLLKLIERDLAVSRVELANDRSSVQPATLDTGSQTLTLLGGLRSTNVNNSGLVPLIKGRLNLAAGDHSFRTEASVYAGLEITAIILGEGGFTKMGNAALLLTGDNTFSGPVNANDGVLDVRHNHALGGALGDTFIGQGAVTLRNAAISNEVLIASGVGALGELPGSVLTSIGLSSWAGDVLLNTNLVVTGDMTFTGQITGDGGLGCFGGGTIRLGGLLVNKYFGRTLVRCPLLELAKTNPVPAVWGPLEIGGGPGPLAEVRLLNRDQIRADLAGPITIRENGLLNLNGRGQGFDQIFMYGGRIETGIGLLRSGVFSGSIDTFPSASPAIINGQLYVDPGFFDVGDGTAEPDLIVNAIVSGSRITKAGRGTMSLTGANTYDGITRVNQGILVAGQALALGTSTFGTTVDSGATLQLDNLDAMNESIELNGTGVGGTFGALCSHGSATLVGGVYFNTPSTIQVNQAMTLTVVGRVAGNGPLTKTGPGTLFFGNPFTGDPFVNTYTGATHVVAGTLALAKNQNFLAVPEELVLGPASASAPATVRFYRSGMLNPSIPLTANANSLIDLNGNNQTLSRLNLNDGADVQTGTGTLGFTDVGSIHVGTWSGGLSGLRQSASISGRIAAAANNYLVFNVAGYGRTPLTPDPELIVSAQIAGNLSSIAKNGPGTMLLSGNNTFAGSASVLTEFDINDGTVTAASNGALGGANNWVYVLNGARLALVNNITIADKPLYLMSTNTTALDNPGGNNFWTGPVTLARDTSMRVNQDWSLFLYGVVSGSSANDLTKLGQGTLIFGGGSANTYLGETFVNEGQLHLAKPIGFASVPGALSIGSTNGAPASAVNYSGYQIIGNIFVNRNGIYHLNGQEENVYYLGLSEGGDVETGAGGLYLQTGGSIQVDPGSAGDVSTIRGQLGLDPGNHNIVVDSGTLPPGSPGLTIDAFINQSFATAGLRKLGTGTLRLTGNNTYDGVTTVAAGILQVDGSQPQSPIQILGARLQGSGTVGHIAFGGNADERVAPGSSPGILTSSNFNANAIGGGTLEVELNGTIAGTGYDQVNVRGTVNLTGLKLKASLGFASAPNDQFRIINNDVTDPVLGTFDGLPQNAQFYIGGELFQINYAGGIRNDVVLTRLVTPPKPALTIQLIGTNSVRLLWTTNDPAFTLQHSTNLAAADWLPVLPVPVVAGTNNIVTNFTTGSERHYRLRKP